MKAKYVLLIAFLGVALGVVAILVDRPDSEAGGTADSAAIERSESPVDDLAGDSDLARVDAGVTGREATLETDTAGGDVVGTASNGEDGIETRPLVVEVVWPAGVPPADGLIAYAFRRDIPAGNMSRTFASMPGARRPGEGSVFDELDDPSLGGSAIRAALLAEAPVEGDAQTGWRARLDVPADREHVFIHALGGGAYTEQTTEVFAPAETVTLRPTRGATLEIVLRPAEGSESIDFTQTRVSVGPGGDSQDMMAMGSSSGSRFGADVLADDGGRVTLSTVPAEVELEIKIRGEGFAPMNVSVSPLERGEARTVEFIPAAGAIVSGHVIDAEGRDVAGAKVTASIPGKVFGFDDDVVSETTAGDDGRFSLRHVPNGAVIVRADANGALESNRVRVEIVDGADAADVTIMLEEGRSIDGIAQYENGDPAAGVEVRATFDVAHVGGMSGLGAMRGARSRATSGADGRFRLRGLGSGPFSVRAAARPGGEDASEWRARLDGLRPGAENLLLVLRPPLTVSGLVLDGAGAPVAGVEVACARIVPGSLGDMRLNYHSGISDDQGRFEVEGLVAGNWVLTVTMEEYVSLDETVIEVTARVQDTEIRVARTGAVSGTVLDATGAPVADAIVELMADVPEWQKALSREVPSSRTRSRQDGTFLLLGVRPGSIRLTASAVDFSPAEADAIELEPGGLAEGVELRLGRGGTIEGLCFDSDGKPAAGRLVVVQSTSLSFMRTILTSNDGSFVVRGVPTGTYQVIAMNPSADMAGDADGGGVANMLENMNMSKADVVEGETVVVYLGAPPADPVEVSGRVERGGEPYAGAMVAWLPASKSMYEQMKVASTNDEGEYRLVLDVPGDYVVSVARVSGGTGQQETVEFSESVPDGAETHERDFEIPGGAIAGTVVGPDGQPVPGARVTVMARGSVRTDQMVGGSYAEMVTSSQGTFEAAGLRAGTYQVAAGGAAIFGSSSTAPARTIVGDFQLGDDQRIDGVEVRLSEPGSLEVTVRDAAGVGVSDAMIFLRDEKGRHTELFSMTMTDSRGRAKVSGLAPGSYTVAARTSELASQESAPIDVVAGETGQAAVLLEPGATILAVVKAKGDASIPAASIQVLDSEGRDVTRRMGLTDMQSLYSNAEFSTRDRRIGPVPLGLYRVIATADDGRQAKRNVRVDAPGLRRVSLVLR